MIRPQSILIGCVVVMVVLFGVSAVSSQPPGGPVPTPDVALQATVAVSPTSVAASTPGATKPTPPAPVPSPTSEPVGTERPVPPDTGVDGESLIVERGDSGRTEVALTFDAGEGAGHTAQILDMLNEAGIHGTFGVTGLWVEENPELAKRIVDEGHQLINHTYDHASWTGNSTGLDAIDDEQRRTEVVETDRIIEDTTGYEVSPYFRFPYGDYDSGALVLLAELGYSYTLSWSCDTQGWNGYTPEEIVDLCGPEAELGGPGAILLMHVADDNDFGALPVLIEEYAALGYDFVTCEEIIQP